MGDRRPVRLSLTSLSQRPALMPACRSGRSGAGDQYEAGTEELAGLREFRRDAPCMQHSGFLVGVLAPRPVRRQAVFVDDMEEVAHANEVGWCAPGCQ